MARLRGSFEGLLDFVQRHRYFVRAANTEASVRSALFADKNGDAAANGAEGRLIGEIVAEEKDQGLAGLRFSEPFADRRAFVGHAARHHFQVAEVFKELQSATEAPQECAHCPAGAALRARPGIHEVNRETVVFWLDPDAGKHRELFEK